MTTEAKTTYSMVASGPAVPAEEVERAEQAVEVVVMWGDSALHVAHLSPPRPFYIGEEGEDGETPDWLCGAETLGVSRLPIVLEGPAGPQIVIPDGADLRVTIGDETRDLASLVEAELLSPCAALAGARSYALPPTASAEVEFGGFTFIVRPTRAGRRIGMGFAQMMAAMDRTGFKYVGGALAFFATLLAMTYFLPPAGGGLSLETIDESSRIVDYLSAAPELIEEDAPSWIEQGPPADEGGTGDRAADAEGQMGDEESEPTQNRSGIEGPADNEDVHMANREAQREAAQFAGALGVLAQMSGAWNEPTSPYGRDTALGNDPVSALGAIMGDNIGNNFGFGGLGLTGTGRGGGGDGRGTYGLDNGLATIGRGAGCENPPCGDGYGRNIGLRDRARPDAVPTLRTGPVSTAGALSAETIRRVVHRHRNEVRHCYEQELSSRPDLEGRVTVSFIISNTGAVMGSEYIPSRSTIRNDEVSSCVASAVRRWSFPQPENGGVVSVTYPFLFSTH
jgi:TonB family protein